MAVTYTNAVKIARMAAVVSQSGPSAVLEIGTTAMGTVLATFNLNSQPDCWCGYWCWCSHPIGLPEIGHLG